MKAPDGWVIVGNVILEKRHLQDAGYVLRAQEPQSYIAALELERDAALARVAKLGQLASGSVELANRIGFEHVGLNHIEAACVLIDDLRAKLEQAERQLRRVAGGSQIVDAVEAERDDAIIRLRGAEVENKLHVRRIAELHAKLEQAERELRESEAAGCVRCSSHASADAWMRGECDLERDVAAYRALLREQREAIPVHNSAIFAPRE